MRSIEGLTPAQLRNLVVNCAADEDAWRPRLRFDAAKRFCLLLHSNELTDVWLLSWLTGQHTTLHDHGGSRAAIQVVQGELHELHAEPAGKLREHRLTWRAPHLLGPDAIHDVVNTAGPEAVSIHAYSPPLRTMTYYERDGDRFRPTLTIATRHPEPGMNIDELLAAARGRIDRITVRQAATEYAAGTLLVDIRPDAQRRSEGEIPGSLVIERNVLEWRFDPSSAARIPEATGYDLRVVIFCSEGYTSSLAADSLRALGLCRATDMSGGFALWHATGLPTVAGGTPAGSFVPARP